MAKRIKIELPGDSFFAEIQGERPTPSEELKLMKIISERKSKASRPNVSEKISQDEQMFDTVSGIKDASLRAALSAAETPEDEELQLRNLYGLTETDYMRDSRGRLAITPSGGKKLGIELSQPTMIDESGFSRYDFADMAGIAPEVVGGVAGAIKGAALGLPLGPAGVLLGGAIGAGTGAAAGQGVEEVVETVAGVQGQTFGEVAKDLGKEFAIGFLTDATLGTFGVVARGAKGLTKSGKGLTEDELKVAAESIEMGINPTLSAIRAPSVVARQQGIIEKIFGNSPRLKQNNDVMQKKLSEFREQFGTATDDEAGQILLQATGAQAKRLDALQKSSQQAVMKTLRNLGDDLGAAAEKNMNIDADIFDTLVGAQKAFDGEVSIAFKSIDDALDSSVGDIDIIPVGNLKEVVKDIEAVEAAGLAGREMPMLRSALDAVKTIKGDKSSYLAMYKLRKTLNDLMSKTSSKTERDAINDMMRKIDVKLNSNFVKEAVDSAGGISAVDKKILLRASDSLDNARKVYNEGASIFEDIEAAGIIKNLSSKAKAGQTPGIDDIRLEKIIRDDRPEVLERMFKAVEYGASKDAKIQSSELFRQKVASEWLNDALGRSGLSKINDFDPSKFKGAAFAESVRKLGRTADVLFGPDAAKIKKLAGQIEKTSLSNLDQAAVNQIVSEVGENAPLASKLTALLQAQKAISLEQKSAALRKLQSGELAGSPIQAADVIANRATTAADIKKIMATFGSDTEALDKIRGNYMERLIADFGDTLTTDGKQLGAFAKRLLDADAGGKLGAIFGEETGKDMAKFARILDFNSRTAAGGDLIAANIAASPIQNIGKLAKYGILTNLLRFTPYYKQIVDDYAKLAVGETAESKSKILGRLIAQSMTKATAQYSGQSLQEGSREVENQVRAVADSSGLSQQLSNLSQQIQQPTPNNSPAMPQQVAPVAPGPNNLRQQAAQNPGIAQALGIRGSTAGLLQP